MKKVDSELEKLSPTELKNILLTKAADISAPQREVFLNEITSQVNNDSFFENTLKEFLEFQEKVEDGFYSEGWGWDSDYCEEREWGDESWADEVDDFFRAADYLLASENFLEARIIYEKLMSILEDCELLPGPPDARSLLCTDLDKVAFKIYRIIYLTSLASERVDLLYKEAIQNPYLWRNKGFLTGVLAIDDTSQLPGFYGFLNQWVELLKTNNSASTDLLLREAVMLMDGSEGLEIYAKKMGSIHPGFWIDLLKITATKKDYKKVKEYCEQAMDAVNPDYTIYAEIGDYLIEVGKHLKNNSLIQHTARKCFYSNPTLERLVFLASQADGKYDVIMIEACKRVEELFISNQTKSSLAITSFGESTSVNEYIYAWVLVFSSQFDKLQEFCHANSPTWTDTGASVTFTVLHRLLSCEDTSNQIQLLKIVLPKFYDKQKVKIFVKLLRPIVDQTINSMQKKKYLNWCMEISNQHITYVVSNKYRDDYPRAALLAVSMAELINEIDSEHSAKKYLMGWKQKFLRHRLFREALRKNASKSKVAAVAGTEI